MPLPLGHAAIGLTTCSLCSRNNNAHNLLKITIFVAILSNLPDIDVVIGLIFKGNGNIFHRGPTHSLLFAILMGYLASKAYELWSQIPKLKFRICFLIILSHVVADYLFTDSPVSFFWPFEMNFASGYSGWFDVINSVLIKAYQDGVIIAGCIMILLLNRFIFFLHHHLAESFRHNHSYGIKKEV